MSADKLKQIAWIDGLCDRFEAAWQARRKPTVAEFLRESGINIDAASPDLITELARIEAAYRKPDESGKAETVTLITPGGRHVGRYQLRRRIGSGGFGEVWVAFDTELEIAQRVRLRDPGEGLTEGILQRIDRSKFPPAKFVLDFREYFFDRLKSGL